MRKIPALLAALAAALLLSACASSPRVYSNIDPQADFNAYTSFGFVERAGTDRGEYASLLTGQLQRATRQAMEARGYRFDAANPDLLVNFNLSTQQVIESRPGPAFGFGGYYPYRWGGYGPWSGWGYNDIREYREGTLNIDIVDAAERRLVWEGMSVTRLGRDGYQARDEMIDAAVTAIFARYPHAAGR